MTTAVPTALPVYNWKEPAHIQESDWDCSQESLEWCLWAYGRTPDDTWMEQSLQAGGYINPAVGCTDATGAGLAMWLNEQYDEYGYQASNSVGRSFDQVKDEAATRKHPVAMGGAAFYHWVGVRGYDPTMDRLLLANPAPGWHGVYQTMTRAQFAAQGPFNLVRLTHPEAEGGGSAVATHPFGPDVSSHQGAVDWHAVRAAGALYGFTKMSGGAWYRNPTGPTNWHGMAQAALQRGAYHFAFEPSGQPLPGPGPEAEAAYFLETVMPLGLVRGDMLALDIEAGAGELGSWALRWLKHVEKHVGFKPLLYTASWFADPHGFAQTPELAAYALWQADYDGPLGPPCAPWQAATFWQYTDKAAVPGISTPCDGNRFLGPPDQLLAQGKPGDLPTEDPYAPWSGLVGSGLLDLMARDGVLPAQARSTWLPLGQSPADVEQCLGSNMVNYAWSLTENRGARYAPIA